MSMDTGTIHTYWFRVYDRAPEVRHSERQVGRYIVSIGNDWRTGFAVVNLAVVDDFGDLVAVS